MDFINATSGGISAAAATGAIYPLDTLVVRYQAAISKRHGQQTVSGILAEALRQPNGVLGLYKGMSFKMVEQLIRNFVYFYWYNLFKRSWRKKFGPLSTSSNLFVATAAAAMNQCMTAPLEVISTNLQTTPMNVKQILRHVYEQEGIQGFYRGFGASLILCSNPAITSVAFDQLKALLQPPSSGESDIVFNKHASITSWQSFLLGAFAKALATAVTYPYIRSKVLVQANAGKRRKSTVLPPETDKVVGEATQSNQVPISTSNGRSMNRPSNRSTSSKPRELSSQELIKVASFCISDRSEVCEKTLAQSVGRAQRENSRHTHDLISLPFPERKRQLPINGYSA
eukprot:GHVN01091872.1.p1 GENE.GHVN01091872.1~~GHVN01091872.1.p1  ORF type:complete len:342 (+),score=31.61 GHVN01091872.1:119-1144(+)